MKIYKINKTKSTNDYINKVVTSMEDTVVIADEQTKGRGTKGRSFSSAKGGLYMTYYRVGRGERAQDAFKIMMQISLAVVKTVEVFGVHAEIKWPNDVYVNGKKICGILTQNFYSGEYVSHSIIGIGVNVLNELPKSLKNIAVSLKDVTENANLEIFTATLLHNLTLPATVEEYKRYSLLVGKKVKAYVNGKIFYDYCVDVTETGEVVLKNNGKTSYGEIKAVEYLSEEEERFLDGEFYPEAIKYLEKNRLKNCDLICMLQQDCCKKIYFLSENGFCMELRNGVVCLSCQSKEVADEALSYLDGEKDCFICHGDVDKKAVMQSYPNYFASECYQVEYNVNVRYKRSKTVKIKKLDVSYAETVAKTYNLGISVKGAEELISECGMWGAFIDGQLVGYIGFHQEKSIGLLEVFPEFKRRGIGMELIRFMIDVCRKTGKIAYCHIIKSNMASYNLHQKIDCVFATDSIYWCFKKT